MRFKTECPRCGKRGQVEAISKPRIHCGYCLVDHCEVVTMITTTIVPPPQMQAEKPEEPSKPKPWWLHYKR